jgi:hypothetical protein
MESVYLVYKTDVHHSYASRDIIGVATTESMAVAICTEHAERAGEPLEGDAFWNLAHLKQTQGYSGEGEYQYEEVVTDTIL